MENITQKGIQILATVLKKSSTISKIEKEIFKSCSEKKLSQDDFQDRYNEILYQTLGDIIQKIKTKDIIKRIRNKQLLWKHPTFKKIKMRLIEHDEFIVNPFEVEEGVTQCKKCHSKRVFTHQSQTRSSDETMSTIAKCVKCKSTWVYSG